MNGLPLACFDKPAFEQDGLEFFICNGGSGLGGVRRKPSLTVFVADPNLARNLNMKAAKAGCESKRFAVASDANGYISFRCDDKQVDIERFQPASKSDWTKYKTYLR